MKVASGNSMKVLVFTSLYPNNVWPNQGVFIKERMTHFGSLEGCQIKVIAPVPYFPPVKLNWRWKFSQVMPLEIRDGIEVYHPRYFLTPKLGMPLYGLFLFLSVFRTVRKVRKAFDFDIIDAHFVYPDGFAAILLGKCFKKPVVVSARGSDISLYSDFPIIRRLLQYTLHRAAEIISVCMALKEAMVQLGIPARKIKVVRNGVDIRKFHGVPKETARQQLALPAEKKIILSVGGIIPRKGFDLLIRAFHILVKKERVENLHLVIVGDGADRCKLEDLTCSLELKNCIQFVGAVPHNDLYLWYSAADLFCLASDREGWPNVLLESLACGTPVVATKIWGIPEVVCSDELGLLAERSETAIAQKISFALNRQWWPDDLVEYAKRNTWDRTAWRVRRVFEGVLKSQQNAIGAGFSVEKPAARTAMEKQ